MNTRPQTKPGHAAPRAVATPDAPLESLFTGLRHALNDADPLKLPDLLGRLEAERLRAEMRLHRSTPADTPAADQPLEDDLLTLPQVAALLGVPEDYAYSLARQRKIPTVRLPGLERGGRTTAGKYVRVRRAALVEWLALHADQPLDGCQFNASHLLRAARSNAPTAEGLQPPVSAARRAARAGVMSAATAADRAIRYPTPTPVTEETR